MSTHQNYRKVLLATAYLIVFITGAIGFVAFSNDCLDDHYITYRYSKNLANGRGLVWNVGERPVEGYTSFSWVLFNAAAIRAGISPLLASKAISLLAGLGLLVITVLPINTLIRSGVWRIPLGTLIASCPVLLFYSGSGMETGFFTGMLTAGTIFWLKGRMNKSEVYWLLVSSIALAVAFLTRPEAALIWAIIVLSELFAKRPAIRGNVARVLLVSVPFATVAGTYLLWRLRHYGYPYPNTYYAKHSGNRLENLPLGGLYLAKATNLYLIAPIAVILGVSLMVARDQSNEQNHAVHIVCPLASMCVVYAFYVAWVGGDDNSAFPSVRLLCPMLPLLWLALFVLCDVQTHNVSYGRRIVLATSISLVCSMVSLPDFSNLMKLSNSELQSQVTLCAFLPKLVMKPALWSKDQPGKLPQWIECHTEKDDLIAIPWAGRVSYYTNRSILDMLGLNDIHIAHTPSKQRGIDTKMDPDYVVARRPGLIFINVGSSYWRGEKSFEDAGGWKEGDRQLLNLMRSSTAYQFVNDAPTSSCVFRRK